MLSCSLLLPCHRLAYWSTPYSNATTSPITHELLDSAPVTILLPRFSTHAGSGGVNLATISSHRPPTFTFLAPHNSCNFSAFLLLAFGYASVGAGNIGAMCTLEPSFDIIGVAVYRRHNSLEDTYRIPQSVISFNYLIQRSTTSRIFSNALHCETPVRLENSLQAYPDEHSIIIGICFCPPHPPSRIDRRLNAIMFIHS